MLVSVYDCVASVCDDDNQGILVFTSVDLFAGSKNMSYESNGTM
jgi:hypothetical protein